MEKIISCDWGTSVLRLRLADADAATVLAEVKSLQGIANTFELWKKTGRSEDQRLFFYRSVLSEQIKKIEEQLRTSLDDVPVIISGMASSNIGIVELPYKEIPFGVDAPDLYVKRFEATSEFKHSILLISGVKTTDDAMRGEETQLTGCLNENDKEEHLFIFPGTHSKHVTVKDQRITGIKTYMTGEFFELLSGKSILSSSVMSGKGLEEEVNKKNFEEGVNVSRQSNLLHNSFLVRTNHLFKKLTKEENYYYLSGLVIGTELGELMINKNSVILVASGEMQKLYAIAIKRRLNGHMDNFRMEDSDQALIKGQLRIANHFNE